VNCRTENSLLSVRIREGNSKLPWECSFSEEKRVKRHGRIDCRGRLDYIEKIKKNPLKLFPRKTKANMF
jgi:hypothetical protein